jgi:ammonium transporter Rh
MLVSGGIALLIGFISGIISCIGYTHVKPLLDKYGVNDTCGVNALHGMPAIAGGIIGYIACISVTEETAMRSFEAVKQDREIYQQGIAQLASMLITFTIAIMGGAFTGSVSRMCFGKPIKNYTDYEHVDDDQIK